MHKKTIISAMLAVVAATTSIGAATGDKLNGSDTLEAMTKTILSGCSGVGALQYLGGGSGLGESQMLAQAQQVSPMSRFLADAATCRAATPAEAEGKLVALDGIVLANDAANTQCSSKGMAFQTSQCFTVSDLNGVPGVDCPDCQASPPNTYCFTDFKDVLRVVFSGMTHGAGSTIGNQKCNSDVRWSLVNNYANLFDGTCTAGTCTQLAHAWRRDDLSGTTDTFITLLGLPAVTSTPNPFCNGAAFEDKDPIRRPCAATDNVCRADHTLGLVLPIFVPDLTVADQPLAYPTKTCALGKFALREAESTALAGGSTRFDCPEKANFSIAGFCLAPLAVDNDAACLSPASNPNVFFTNLSDDARLFNTWLRKPDGTLLRDTANRPQVGSYHHILSSSCAANDSTLDIGCLAGHYKCSIGYAGREATDTAANGAVAYSIKGILPTDANVRKFLTGDPDVYPLARGLYFSTMVGFHGITDAHEAALATCYGTQATVDAAATSAGFITLGQPIVCTDYNETHCNNLAVACDTDADCGTTGICNGGNPATQPKEGFCDNTCNSTTDCKGGRTCVSNKCIFATNKVNGCN